MLVSFTTTFADTATVRFALFVGVAIVIGKTGGKADVFITVRFASTLTVVLTTLTLTTTADLTTLTLFRGLAGKNTGALITGGIGTTLIILLTGSTFARNTAKTTGAVFGSRTGVPCGWIGRTDGVFVVFVKLGGSRCCTVHQ
jgi:hypothetical protein